MVLLGVLLAQLDDLRLRHGVLLLGLLGRGDLLLGAALGWGAALSGGGPLRRGGAPSWTLPRR